jgi:hypothetical protein
VQANQKTLAFERDHKAQNCTLDEARSLREFAQAERGVPSAKGGKDGENAIGGRHSGN